MRETPSIHFPYVDPRETDFAGLDGCADDRRPAVVHALLGVQRAPGPGPGARARAGRDEGAGQQQGYNAAQR